MTTLPVPPSGGTGRVASGSLGLRACAALVFLAGACHPAPHAADAAGADRDAVAPARVIDSILPLEEEIRRFTTLSPPHLSLSHGAHSREELVARWAAAVEARDSSSLTRLHITPNEFIGLYYPNSIYTSPPYRQSPSLVWFRMVNSSSRGSTRVMQRHGGEPFHLRGVRCEESAIPSGSVRIWGPCLVERQVETTVREQRLFGSILEHNGQFKFLSYDSEY